MTKKFRSVFSTRRFSGRSMYISFRILLTVNGLKIQQKWLLSGTWFYALNSPKSFVGRALPEPAGGAYSAPPDSLAGSREEGEEMGMEEREGGKEERKEAGEKRSIPTEWKFWLWPWINNMYKIKGGRNLLIHEL